METGFVGVISKPRPPSQEKEGKRKQERAARCQGGTDHAELGNWSVPEYQEWVEECVEYKPCREYEGWSSGVALAPESGGQRFV